MKYLCLVLALLAGSVQSQEILKGKVPIAEATCHVDKNFVMAKGNPIAVPCVLFVDMASDEDGWVLIVQNGKPLVVIHINPATKSQEIVWVRGQTSL